MFFTNRAEFMRRILLNILLKGIVEPGAYYSHLGLTRFQFEVTGLPLVPREAHARDLGRFSGTFNGNGGGSVVCIVKGRI